MAWLEFDTAANKACIHAVQVSLQLNLPTSIGDFLRVIAPPEDSKECKMSILFLEAVYYLEIQNDDSTFLVHRMMS